MAFQSNNLRRLRDRLRNRVMLISGSSRGIGRECAYIAAVCGARVMIHGRDAATLHDLKKRFKQEGVTVASAEGDISNYQQASRIVTACIKRYGRLDILINNAGISMRGRFADCDPIVYKEMLHTNVLGSMHLTKAALPYLRPESSVVLVSSAVGLYGFPGVIPYSLSKMALSALYQGLDAELFGRHIRIGIVYLGFVANDAHKKVLSAEGQPITVQRRHTISQVKAARSILQCATRGRRVCYVGLETRLVAILARLSPAFLVRIGRASGGRIHSVANKDISYTSG